jgi:hypothetical protein
MRCITSTSEDIKEQLLTRIKCHPKSAFQINESTDVAELAQLLVFVRYYFEENIQEEFMFCQLILERFTGSDIFKVVNDYFKVDNISWANHPGNCTDRPAALTGYKKGFQAKVQQIGAPMNFTHRINHRKTLALYDLESKFHSVLQEAMKVMNYVKAHPLNPCLFAVLCEEIQADHKPLILPSEVRWLTRGKVLERLVELEEVWRFLQDSGFHCMNTF